MIVPINDFITAFANASDELVKLRAFDNPLPKDGGWYRYFGITVHWRGALIDKFEFDSEQDYMLFLLKWS